LSSIGLVATDSASESGDLLAIRLRALLDAGWNARLVCHGERWERDGAVHDPGLATRVEFTRDANRYSVPRSLFRRPPQLLRYLSARGELRPFRSLLELQPELIHFHSATAARKGARLRRLLDCRTVVSFREDGGDLVSRNPQHQWDEADLFLFPDEGLLERGMALGCLPERAEMLRPPPPDSAPIPAGRNPARGPVRILSAGPMSWEQGFEHSVHAIRLLLDQDVECGYRILGEGEHLTAVAFARHELNLADHVELVRLGGGYSLAEEMRAAHIFLDPAVADRTARTPLIMAQALGVPFVATRRDGLSDDAGMTVPRRDARAIAEGLAKLAGDPALRARLGDAGRARADRHPSLEEHLGRLEDLYQRALA
jgi:glycosyltransferase involved in cell wall biosynthesis